MPGRYATKKYGTFTYGATGNENLLWAIEVDWDDDAVFDGSNEARFCVDYFLRRGRRYFLRSEGMGFEHFRRGRLRLLLFNENGRYDPFNTSSPLYPNVEPGKYIRVRVKTGTTGTFYDRFAGRIEDIEPRRVNGLQYVIVTATDGWSWLQNKNATVAVQEDIATGDAIDKVLDDADWPSIWGRSLATGDDTIDYWWEDQRSAAASINDLADSENGRFYIASDGTATFDGRNTVSESVATINEDVMDKDIEIVQPWDTVRNVARVVARPRVSTGTVELWRLRDIPQLADGDSLEVFADFFYDNRVVAGQNLIAPAATTDFTVNTAQDGSGSDLTTGCVSTIETTFSQTAKLKIENNSGSDGYITLWKLRGDALDAPDKVILETDGSGSNQPRIFEIDSKWQQGTTRAKDYSVYLEDFLSNTRDFPVISLVNRFDKQFAPDLTDRVSLEIPTYDIDSGYRVGYIAEQWLSDNGQAVRTDFRFEPFQSVSEYWIFDNDLQFDVNTTFGY